jgi:type IV pilus assembly protein PilN
VLPVGVQVTSIEPQVTPEGDVAIRLRVSGDRDRAVELVRNLERSRRFLHPRLAGESSQQKENAQGFGGPQNFGANPGAPAGVEFDILADYNPLPANESYHFAKPRAESAAVVIPPNATPLGARLAMQQARSGQSLVVQPQPLPSNGTPRYGVVLKPYSGPQQPPRPMPMPPRPMQRPGGQP